MLVAIHHKTFYDYDGEAGYFVQRLRLTPPDTPSQKVKSWTVDAPGIKGAATYQDAFGNLTHLIATTSAVKRMEISAQGIVDTADTNGIHGRDAFALNPDVFLRPTEATAPGEAILALAGSLADDNALGRMHALMNTIHARVAYDTSATHSLTTAHEALTAARGVCQDHAHIFISAARHCEIPARYVTGYLHLADGSASAAHHAWAEAWIPDLGWVGFDPANNQCPKENYVRLACGFDAPSTAPVTGQRQGDGIERLSVEVLVQNGTASPGGQHQQQKQQ